MKYIYNQINNEVCLTKEEIARLLEIEEDEISEEMLKDVNNGIENLMLHNFESGLYTKFPELKNINNIEIDNLLRKKTEYIRNEVLSRYLLSVNLHILMSNGCSMYAGSKGINKSKVSSYQSLLKGFKSPKNMVVQKAVQDLAVERPEVALDRLHEIASYHTNITKDEKISKQIEVLIREFKRVFVNDFVLTIDYDKTEYHKLLLKRLLSRHSKLNKVNIFTLNYDLLIEKSAEELGISVNNGFAGFHNRIFMPASYNTDLYINGSDSARAITKSLNLFKLHGSLSWKFDEGMPPYGITEMQYDFSTQDINEQIPECIIYPVQSKKKHSLDLPYSEMFRQFIEFVNKPKSTLFVIGYSFLDEHVNDIITNSLSNPDFNLVVFSYEAETDTKISPFLKDLFRRSREDSRITIFSGKVLGNFEYIVKFLIPYSQDADIDKIVFDTYKALKSGGQQ